MGAYWALLDTFLRPQRARLGGLLVLLLGSTALQLAGPQLLRVIVDTASGDGAARSLLPLALAYLGVALAAGGVTIMTTLVAERVGWAATNGLRATLYRHALSLDLDFHARHSPGTLIERVDGDVTSMANFFSRFVVVILGNGLLLIGILAVLLRENVVLGLVMLTLGVLAALFLVRVRNAATPHWVAGRTGSANFAAFIEERLVATEDLKSNGALPQQLGRVAPLMRDMLRHYRVARVSTGYTYIVMRVLYIVTLATSLALGVLLYARGDMTLGTIFLVVTYANLMISPLEQLTLQVQDLQQASAGVLRTRELLDTRPALSDGALSLVGGPPEVAFEHVTFVYPDGTPALHDVHLTLKPGTVTGVVGRTGSGKSTLSRLLLRFYDPTEGRVSWNGTDLRDATFASLRARVGIVTQDVQLLRGTLRDNLALFDERVTDDAMRGAFDALGLLDFLRALPNGLDTRLGPGSLHLSEGEAQLLAFTRIFLRDPSLVILDEASSKLDPLTERRLEHAMTRLLRGRTALVIAHRLHTLDLVTHVLVMGGGRVLEFGRRDDLGRDPASRFAAMRRVGLLDEDASSQVAP